MDEQLKDTLSGLCCHLAAMDAYHWELQAIGHAMTVVAGGAILDDECEKTIEDLGRFLENGKWEITTEERVAIQHARSLMRRNGYPSDKTATRFPQIVRLPAAA